VPAPALPQDVFGMTVDATVSRFDALVVGAVEADEFIEGTVVSLCILLAVTPTTEERFLITVQAQRDHDTPR